MTALYAYVGLASNELLTYQGAVLVHNDEAEMRFLVPNARVIRLPSADLGRPLMSLRKHPDLAAVEWPLERSAFR